MPITAWYICVGENLAAPHTPSRIFIDRETLSRSLQNNPTPLLAPKNNNMKFFTVATVLSAIVASAHCLTIISPVQGSGTQSYKPDPTWRLLFLPITYDSIVLSGDVITIQYRPYNSLNAGTKNVQITLQPGNRTVSTSGAKNENNTVIIDYVLPYIESRPYNLFILEEVDSGAAQTPTYNAYNYIFLLT
ncbi:hypothetical protein BC936DRAFT_149800 [Jimgerdemannia flammicorona]|uniref:Uncharacterized protein n=1 Tax=Jimgerdemannia flammicorona TaxID=994334 RepID=A0A433DJS0_9FUNG|nr:hypothetical protein BC936DRAFT_149800 [Jimgerdemannia flammicorona]